MTPDGSVLFRRDFGSHTRPSAAAVFGAVWVVSSVVIAVLVLAAREVHAASTVSAAVSAVLLGATTWALWAWLGRPPLERVLAAPFTRRSPFALMLAAAVAVLLLVGMAGSFVLLGLVMAAAAVLLYGHERPRPAELLVAGALGIVAAVAGVVDGWARSDVPGALVGVLQLPLVVLSLLAGWQLSRRSGLARAGIGRVVALSDGARPALRDFGLGLVLCLPWALGNVVNGAPDGDDIRTAWHPLAAALQPGIAEEAWARALLIPALFAVFSRTARAGTALPAAVLISSYWFAYLHAPGDPMVILGIGTLYAIPMALLWMRRGLEAAIGFHVGVDLARYTAAYLSLQGLWFV